MGLSAYITDRLMGHIPVSATGKRDASRTNPDLNAIDTQRQIAANMERYIYDPRYSLNPSVTPYTLADSEGHNKSRLDVHGYSEITIQNNTDHPVTLDGTIGTLETGEILLIEAPKNAVCKITPISVPKSWDGIDRIVIGDTTLPKE